MNLSDTPTLQAAIDLHALNERRPQILTPQEIAKRNALRLFLDNHGELLRWFQDGIAAHERCRVQSAFNCDDCPLATYYADKMREVMRSVGLMREEIAGAVGINQPE